MVKLTCICLLLTLLCSLALCAGDSFGENVEIFSDSGLDFAWNYWSFNQHLELTFAITTDSDAKLMNARFNYTEGCFKNAACPETTLLSIAMELSDIRKDLVNANKSAIAIFYNIGNMLNVDPKSLELRATNLDGNIEIKSYKLRNKNFIGGLEMNKFLNRNIETVLFTLIGNRLPSRFNYTLGQSVNVTYSQENHFESDRKDLDLVISRQEMVYSISDVKLLTLSDYYKTMCFNNQVYRWIDVIRYDTNVKYVLGNMEMTYTFKANIFRGHYIQYEKVKNINTVFNYSIFIGNSHKIMWYRMEKLNEIVKTLISEQNYWSPLGKLIREHLDKPNLLFVIGTSYRVDWKDLIRGIQNSPELTKHLLKVKSHYSMPQEMFEIRHVVSELVKTNVFTLKKAINFNSDREIVHDACVHNPLALQYASFELRNDKEFVMKFLGRRLNTLFYVGEELLSDAQVLRKGIMSEKEWREGKFDSMDTYQLMQEILKKRPIMVLKFYHLLKEKGLEFRIDRVANSFQVVIEQSPFENMQQRRIWLNQANLVRHIENPDVALKLVASGSLPGKRLLLKSAGGLIMDVSAAKLNKRESFAVHQFSLG